MFTSRFVSKKVVAFGPPMLVLCLSLTACGGGGDSGDSAAGGGSGAGTASTQFTAATYTGVQRTAITTTFANARVDFASVSNNVLTLDGAAYPLITLSDATVIPNGLAQATDGANASLLCKGTVDAYVLFAQTAAGAAAIAGVYSDLGSKAFQEYECQGGTAVKGGLLTFDATGTTILTVVKNGVTVQTNVPTAQVAPLVYKVGGKVYLVNYGVEGSTPYLILALPQ